MDNGSILGFGPDLAPDHPGYGDAPYARRRAQIAAAARRHVAGTPPPGCAYTASETAVWGEVLTRLGRLSPGAACREYGDALPALAFRPGAIPQLAAVGAALADAGSGWAVRPVAGLLHPRDFLAGLAFRTFHATQYVRHASRPDYTPEPDVCHELIGHIPMLLDPHYAAMAHAIGVASLGASDKAVWALTRVYWHTVEFGVVMEEGAGQGGGGGRPAAVGGWGAQAPPSSPRPSPLPPRPTPKAFGAGILSSPGELAHFASGAASLSPLDPWAPLPRMDYKGGYQRHYFTLPSFAAGADMLAAYAAETTPQATRARFGLVGLGAGRLVPGRASPTAAVSSSVVPFSPPPGGVVGGAALVDDGEEARPASPPQAAGKP